MSWLPPGSHGRLVDVLVVRSDVHVRHHGLELSSAQLIRSWESPERARHVDAALDPGAHAFVEPQAFDRALACRVHDPDYVAFLESAWLRWEAEGHEAPAAMAFGWPARRFRDVRPELLEAQLGYYSFAADCSIMSGTWEAAADSAALAVTAARAVADGDRVAFARCRPPGHHAMRDQFGGYCYLNNAALAAQALRDAGRAQVAVLDVDYHHGNGTQDIFYERPDVRVANIHADPRHEFPYFLGHADEVGAGAGEGHNRNFPLPLGTASERWFQALEEALEWLEASSPEALVVSLGLDTFKDDPISYFRLQREDFTKLGVRLEKVGLPTVLVLEGGYATAELGHNLASVLRGFDGQRGGEALPVRYGSDRSS